MTRFIEANIPVAYIGPDGSAVENDMAAAAAYLSWIAYPKPDQAKRADRFVKAIRALPYKAQGKRPPTDLQGIAKEKIEGTINDAMTIIGRRRWPAVWMALKLAGADADYQGLGVRGAADLLTDPDATKDPVGGALIDEGDKHNLAARVWYETLPALAMTMALPGPRASKAEWLQHPEWLPQAVLTAQRTAATVADRFNAKTMLVPRLIAVRS